jgi:hypothetical protein
MQATDSVSLASLRVRASMLGWTEIPCAEADLEYSVHEQPHGLNLVFNGECLYSTTDLAALVDAFEDHAKIALALRAPHHLFVHAGVVGWRGMAIVVPGRSRSGKTVLIDALVRAGAEYYSDEFAVFDAQGHVHPYAIPLAIRSPHGRHAISVEAIGGRAGAVPIPVGLIAITQYHPRARWRPRPVSPAHGMLALMDNTVAARRSPERTMPVLRAAVDGAVILRSRRGDAVATAEILLAQLR